MAKLVVMITSRVEEGHRVGEAWQAVGAPGVTFLESYGLHRMQEASKSGEILPGMISMLDMLRQSDEISLTILTLLPDETLVDTLLEETRDVMGGDLSAPNTGVFFVLDVERAIGVRDFRK